MMKIGLSTQLLLNHRLTTVWLDRIWHAGFPLVEIFCSRRHFDYQNRAQVNELGHWFRDSGLLLHALHAPKFNDESGGRSGPRSSVNITDPVKSHRMEAVAEVKRALEVAEVIPFRYLIQHLGTADEEFSEEKIDAALTSLEEIRLFANQRGVEILLENTHNDLSTAGRLRNFLVRTHLKMGFCFDTGHAHLCGSVESEFHIMAELIRSTHVSDNDGSTDSHSYPFAEKGTIDWPAVMKLFGERAEQFPLMLEVRDGADAEHPLDRAKKAGEQLLGLI